MMTPDGRVVLTDFGLSKMQSSITTFSGGNSARAVVGTSPFMAPECWDDEARPGPPADIYAFAMVAFALLTGALPWQGLSDMQIMKNVSVTGKRPGLPASVPAKLRQLIELCWAPQPSSRPTAAGALRLLREEDPPQPEREPMLIPLAVTSDEFRLVHESLTCKASDHHYICVEGVLKVVAPTARRRFDASGTRMGGNTTRLFHGTDFEASQRIVQQGFRPANPEERNMLGSAVYLTPAPTKAAFFCQCLHRSHHGDGCPLGACATFRGGSANIKFDRRGEAGL
eukprot:RCo004061